MKCEIIRDLMPSYIDEMTSAESNQEIEKHLETCDKCCKYRNSLRQTISSKEYAEKNADEIKPFKKIKKALDARTIILIIFLIGFVGAIIYGQYECFYSYGEDAAVDDVRIEYEAIPLGENTKIVTLHYLPTKDDIFLAVGYSSVPSDDKGTPLEESDAKDTHMGIIKWNINPFKKNTINHRDTCEYWFIDKDTLFDPSEKKEVKLTGEEKLIIEFAGDVIKELPIKNLYTGEGLDDVEIISN